MDEVTFAKIADKVVGDYRVNEQNIKFFCWDGSSSSDAPAGGVNFYGENESWFSATTGTSGWCGFGQCLLAEEEAGVNTELVNKLPEIIAHAEDYTLHLAIKSTFRHSVLFFLNGTGAAAQVRSGISIYSEFDDNGTKYPYIVAQDYAFDGEWYEIEIPVADLVRNGLSYETIDLLEADFNIWVILNGGVTDENMQWDAVFFYKK